MREDLVGAIAHVHALDPQPSRATGMSPRNPHRRSMGRSGATNDCAARAAVARVPDAPSNPAPDPSRRDDPGEQGPLRQRAVRQMRALVGRGRLALTGNETVPWHVRHAALVRMNELP
jgi:hypothetical protein